MSQDTELFELCEAVFDRKPEWKTDTRVARFHDGYRFFTAEQWDDLPVKYIGSFFLYTSDYLLEKLAFKEPFVGYTLSDGWIAYTKDFNVREGGLFVGSTSPTLALLKLTIALDDAGELK